MEKNKTSFHCKSFSNRLKKVSCPLYWHKAIYSYTSAYKLAWWWLWDFKGRQIFNTLHKSVQCLEKTGLFGSFCNKIALLKMSWQIMIVLLYSIPFDSHLPYLIAFQWGTIWPNTSRYKKYNTLKFKTSKFSTIRLNFELWLFVLLIHLELEGYKVAH